MIYFTSDTHFHHKRANEIIGRPFSSMEEADEEMIKRWNQKIPKDGIVYHLGDFSFSRNVDEWKEVLHKLNYKKLILIQGNHDDTKTLKKLELEFYDICWNGGLHMFRYNGIEFTLSHYPMLSWNKVHHNFKGNNGLVSANFYGHHHAKIYDFLKPITPYLKYQLDVGVDGNNFYPYTIEEVISKIKEQCNVKN